MTEPDAPRGVDDLQEAVDRLQEQQHKPRPEVTEKRPPRRLPVWAVWVAAAAFLGAAAWAWSTQRDPFPVSAEDVTAQTIQAIDLARASVEAYRVEHGQLPSSLEAVGLDGLPLEYSVQDGTYDIVGVDGWGLTVGYHGEPGGAS